MPGCFLNARGGGITIGDNTHLARDVVIYSYSHNHRGEALPYDDTAIDGAVHIGQNCWLGMGVKVKPGVTIGEGVIIQLGTIVTEDVPPLALYGMQRGHVFGMRDKEHYNRLVKEGAFGGANGVKIPIGGANGEH
jgi:acetyltransferase-like isoleucine patch superfamily enzyme